MPKYAEEILAAVTELQRHPTAEQVFMEMKKEHPSIAIGTVYKHLSRRSLAYSSSALHAGQSASPLVPCTPQQYRRTMRVTVSIPFPCSSSEVPSVLYEVSLL